MRHKDGSWRLVEGVGRDLLGDPDIGAVVLNVRDVTEQRRTE
jgi:PAS domain-containing protein